MQEHPHYLQFFQFDPGLDPPELRRKRAAQQMGGCFANQFCREWNYHVRRGLDQYKAEQERIRNEVRQAVNQYEDSHAVRSLRSEAAEQLRKQAEKWRRLGAQTGRLPQGRLYDLVYQTEPVGDDMIIRASLQNAENKTANLRTGPTILFARCAREPYKRFQLLRRRRDYGRLWQFVQKYRVSSSELPLFVLQRFYEKMRQPAVSASGT